MTDARLTAAFATFDLPVEPDPAFAERLFEDLAVDLGLRPDRAPRGLRRRLRRAVGLERMPTGPAARRLAYLAAAVGLLFAAALLAIAVGSLLRREERVPVRLSAAELVRLSQGATDQPPALVEEIAAPGTLSLMPSGAPGIWKLTTDGSGTWRMEPLPGAPETADGRYYLFRPGRIGHYEPENHAWSTTDVDLPPESWMNGFLWRGQGKGGAPARVACADPHSLPGGSIAGRPADHVVRNSKLEFWLDKETHLVLRYGAGADRSAQDPQLGAWENGFGITATAFSLAASPDPAAFSWSGPPGAHVQAVTTLPIGKPLPEWSGSLLAGGTMTSGALRGMTTVIWFWSGCSCDVPALASVESAAQAVDGGVRVVAISEATSSPEKTADLVAGLGVTLPIVLDRDGSIGRALQLDLYGYFVLDPEGRLLETRTGNPTESDLRRILSDRGTR